MKILLISGFLGSGKTSFLLQLARYMAEKMGIENIAVLENEIGELSIDDKLIKGSGFEVRSLFSGCVCCSMAGELPVTVHRIEEELHPEWLLMEATGLAFPDSIRDNIESSLGINCRICCLADAKRWERIIEAMKDLVSEQIASADVILINKIDLVDDETLKRVEKSVRSINSKAYVSKMCAGGEIPEGIFEKALRGE